MNATPQEAAAAQKVENIFTKSFDNIMEQRVIAATHENIFIKSMDNMIEQRARAHKTIEFVTVQAHKSVIATTLHLSKHSENTTKQYLDLPPQEPAVAQLTENIFIKSTDNLIEQCARAHKTIEFVTVQAHQSVVATTLHLSKHLESTLKQYLDLPPQEPAVAQLTENTFIKSMDNMIEQCALAHKTIESVTARAHLSVVDTTLHLSKHLERTTKQCLDLPLQEPAAAQLVENIFIKSMDMMTEQCARGQKILDSNTAQMHQSVVAITLQLSKHSESTTKLYLDTVKAISEQLESENKAVHNTFSMKRVIIPQG